MTYYRRNILGTTIKDNGITYSRTYCDYPLCVPSRAALLSGRKNNAIEAWNNFKGLDPNRFRNWTTDFQENGYNVKLYGKMDDLSGVHSESERVETWLRNVNFALQEEPKVCL